MLQQTQASRVAEVFPRFMVRFPTVDALASVSLGDVLRAWAGLGYHRRAAALHGSAIRIVEEHDGAVPHDPGVLQRLPGIGPYTAAAVASIAYGAPVATVDTNVHKVMARVEHGVERDEVTLAQAAAAAESWLDRAAPGDWNQALMTLGRIVCRTRPLCDSCPLAGSCQFRSGGRQGRASAPRQAPFEGSSRQVRGAVLRILRERSATLHRVAIDSGYPPARVMAAVTELAEEGLVVATPAALAGRATGHVGLPD